MVGRGSINAEIARQREIELSRQAERRAPILSELNATRQHPTEAVTIRPGAVGDQLELAQLAKGQRDSLPERPRLIAELGGVQWPPSRSPTVQSSQRGPEWAPTSSRCCACGPIRSRAIRVATDGRAARSSGGCASASEDPPRCSEGRSRRGAERRPISPGRLRRAIPLKSSWSTIERLAIEEPSDSPHRKAPPERGFSLAGR